MTTEIQTPSLDVDTEWLVVSQVKSHRVVYFTDDPDYVPPTEGDWYYVSPFRGALPQGMSLRNCWRWRFNGHAFVDAGKTAAKPGIAPLLQSNKETLRKLLRDKVDAVRRALAPTCVSGDRVRAARLAEARRLLDEGIAPPESGYLVASAAVHQCAVLEMARQVRALEVAEDRTLLQTERLRESVAAAIDAAQTQEALLDIRQRLLGELATELNARQALQPANTTPRHKQAPPTPRELASEQMRLRVQLREKINDLRRPHVSHYLLDDVVLRHRGRIAQAVVASGGALPPGIDGTTLKSYAAARRIPLATAAQETLKEMDQTAKALLDTEQMKDEMLSFIAQATQFEDIRQASAAIARLQLPGENA